MGGGGLKYYTKSTAKGIDWYVDGYPSNETYGEYATISYTNAALKYYANRDPEKPMFMYFAAQSPHTECLETGKKS